MNLNQLVQEETLTDLINIYPNPSTGFITIKTEENNMSKAAISLRSVYGEQIIQLHNHQQKSKMVWYFNLPSGFYYLNQHLDNEMLSKKIVIH